MNLFETRKNLKDIAKELNQFDAKEVDYIISYVLNESVTKLPLIDEINDKQQKKINKIFLKRITGIPLDKIVNKKNFCGYDFYVNKFVLTPRPETELLAQYAVKTINDGGIDTVLDLCTGSGCIGISVALQTGVSVTASDISGLALRVAKRNNKELKANVKFIRSNLFDKIKGKFDLIVTNPPYIPTGEIDGLQIEVKNYDPHLALDGGKDGLDFYKEISKCAKEYLSQNGLIAMEIGENQAEKVKNIFKECDYIESIFDYNNFERILIFRRK